jgi:exopolysaccharide production protein ExoY
VIQGELHQTHFATTPAGIAPIRVALKRALDVIGALLLLATLLPILSLIAAVIVLSSRGGVVYSQCRVGRDGRPFTFYKFRSMAVDSDRVLRDFLDSDPDALTQWAVYQKLPNDPRVTAVGAFIRRTSLDELPQLWNVLLGDMSLVGPRPCTTDQVSLYGASFADYCSVRPGITGLWQVSGRNCLTFAQRVKLDSEYVRAWSLQLDFQILCRTPAVLCSGH